MPAEQIPPDSNVGEVNARLSEGLKTCRSMVANYKALLTGEEGAPEPPAEADGPGSGIEEKARG